MIINMIKLLKKEEKIKYNNLSKLLKIKRRSIKRINQIIYRKKRKGINQNKDHYLNLIQDQNIKINKDKILYNNHINYLDQNHYL